MKIAISAGCLMGNNPGYREFIYKAIEAEITLIFLYPGDSVPQNFFDIKPTGKNVFLLSAKQAITKFGIEDDITLKCYAISDEEVGKLEEYGFFPILITDEDISSCCPCEVALAS